MSGIKIITDSNSGMFPLEGLEKGISVIPMPIYIDGQEHYEGVSISREEFFARQRAGAEIATSQPSVELLQSYWDKALAEYDEALYIPMSRGLSGSVATAKALAREYGGRVQIVDNRRISCTLKQSVLDAKALADKGKSAAEIREILELHGLDASIYIAVDTLSYLKKGGRVTQAGAALASVLNVKPILQIQGDKLDAYTAVRGMKNAQEKMLQAVEHDRETRFAHNKVLIRGAYTCDEEQAEQWRKWMQNRFPHHDISLDPLPLSIACHIGPGAMAIVCMAELGEAKAG